MITYSLEKLVRDSVFQDMLADSVAVDYRQLSEAELALELQRKIVEEAGELDMTSPTAVYELYDILEAAEAAGNFLGYSLKRCVVVKKIAA